MLLCFQLVHVSNVVFKVCLRKKNVFKLLKLLSSNNKYLQEIWFCLLFIVIYCCWTYHTVSESITVITVNSSSTVQIWYHVFLPWNCSTWWVEILLQLFPLVFRFRSGSVPPFNGLLHVLPGNRVSPGATYYIVLLIFVVYLMCWSWIPAN